MRVLVLGGDGFLGWASALHLSAVGHTVAVADSGVRRAYDVELGTSSLVPIAPLAERVACWEEVSGRRLEAFVGDVCDPGFTDAVLGGFGPDAVVHFAEQRSAPYSMIDRAHATHTQVNNVVGTLNVLYAIAESPRPVHLVKLGTMGEYGTPNIDIEEGWLEIAHHGRRDRVLYPKRPGSFYHLSKVHDSHNIEFACRVWGLAATDLNQGVVYGAATPDTARHPVLATRFDYDQVFGTVLNRMVAQAVLGEPLTVYGSGAQVRGMLDIRDTVACVRLALEHPAAPGEYRVFNQFTEQWGVRQLAERVARVAGPATVVEQLPNPRVEADAHYYNAAHTKLMDLGLVPHYLTDATVAGLLATAAAHRDRIDPGVIHPTIDWRSTTNHVRAGTSAAPPPGADRHARMGASPAAGS
ncbi:MAG TPA: NAD-dependent epimerase/dehydratase family protein [Acidimicrobiales bacterium]|nr:NAD-dependent epimerase/dehydratase family protein [Acidimicrobiales bacterium]